MTAGLHAISMEDAGLTSQNSRQLWHARSKAKLSSMTAVRFDITLLKVGSACLLSNLSTGG